MNDLLENVRTDEVTPEELAVVERTLQHLEASRSKKTVLRQVAQWFFVLKIFKELEVAMLIHRNRSVLETRHRAILTCLMGIGEVLVDQTNQTSDDDFAKIGCKRSALQANVRYLREKYLQWYVPVSELELVRIESRLNEHVGGSTKDIPTEVAA